MEAAPEQGTDMDLTSMSRRYDSYLDVRSFRHCPCLIKHIGKLSNMQKRNLPVALPLDNVNPMTRLLERRKTMQQVQESLDAQKVRRLCENLGV
jgi:hypothetical protein